MMPQGTTRNYRGLSVPTATTRSATASSFNQPMPANGNDVPAACQLFPVTCKPQNSVATSGVACRVSTTAEGALPPSVRLIVG